MINRDEHESRTESLRTAIEGSGLSPGPESPCPYLPDRLHRNIAFRSTITPPGVYHSLMDLNYRRSGHVFYRPACRACTQCRNIRVRVDEFRPTRAQRRCLSRNSDLAVRVAPPEATGEKYSLYQRYMAARHDRQMDDTWEGYRDFLYESAVRTFEVTYRLDGRVVAAGIIDGDGDAISTVYCYYEPALERRSLGMFNILWMIEYCRRERAPYLYLGYHIPDCRKMNYKIQFRPCEVLDDQLRWRTVP